MIEAKGLHFSYRDEKGSVFPAIRGINLSIPQGCYVAVIGPNGSGKSTLAALLAGVLFAEAGELKIGGLDPRIAGGRQKLRTLVGLIFQNPDNQLVSVTVERELAFGLENLGVPPQEIRRRVDWVLNKFDLARYRFHSPNKLSGGEKQRLAIASVVAMQPAYLVLDEPTSFLDPAGRKEVLSLLDRLNSAPEPPPAPPLRGPSGKLTIVHITQFPEEACLAQTVVVLNQGKVALEGTPRQVFSRAELLEGIGLALPQLGKLQQLMRKEGLEIAANHCRAEELYHSLIPLRERRNPTRGRDTSSRARALPLSSPFNDKAPSSRLVALEKVSFRYRDFLFNSEPVLVDIDLFIGSGEFVGLVGPTGSGKSTLAYLLSGLLQPTSGRVTLPYLAADKLKVGLILQFPERQFFRERVSEDIAYGLKNLRYGEGQLQREVQASLRLVGLEAQGFGQRQIHTLSGGEKRRIAIASILAIKPRLLILDEPFIALDLEAISKIKKTLTEIHRNGSSVLLISHDLCSVLELATRLIILKGGRIFADLPGSHREIWPQAVLESGMALPEHLALLRRLKDDGWDIDYGDLSLQETATQIVRNLN